MSKLAFALRALPLLAALVSTAAQAQTAAPPPLAATERPALVAPKNDHQMTANISAGATLNGGNTKSFAGTVGGRFQLIHRPNQFTVEALGTYARSRTTVDSPMETTAGNVVGRARYDIFLSENNALFAALAPRHDRFAGLDLRLQSQIGYLRNLYKPSDNHRLWLEVGYDGTFDNFSAYSELPTPPPADAPRPKTDFVHSGRAFLGYTNLLSPLATLNLGVELLYDFEKSDNVRVNTTAEITSSLTTRFKLSVLSRILYDQDPVLGRDKTDYITTIQIVFTYDSVTPPPACPACDCTDEVGAAKAACARDLSVSPADAPSTYDSSAAPVRPAPIQAAPVQPAPATP
jgi:putative salt-induced outer membrane protein YdiY